MGKEALAAFFSDVALGRIADGVEYHTIQQPKHIADDDWDFSKDPNNPQYRSVSVPVPKAAKLADRLKAGELRGKMLMAFVTPIELSGSIDLNIAGLLDSDLAQCIDITPNGQLAMNAQETMGKQIVEAASTYAIEDMKADMHNSLSDSRLGEEGDRENGQNGEGACTPTAVVAAGGIRDPLEREAPSPTAPVPQEHPAISSHPNSVPRQRDPDITSHKLPRSNTKKPKYDL